MSDGGLSTDELMALALALAGQTEIPGDSAVYVAGSGIKRALMGIDVAGAELLLARQLGVDAVIAHHPAGGAAQLGFPRVLSRQVDLMVEAGVPLEVAKRVVQPKIAAALLRAHAANVDHAPSIARLLKLPFLNIHLPLDEVGRRIMVDAIDRHLAARQAEGASPTVQDVIDALRTIPEIRDAPTKPMVPVGRLDNLAGKVTIFHGAGTNGGFAVAEALFDHGVQTVVYIHLAAEDADRLRKLRRADCNVVVSGHIASDLIGINRYVESLEARGVEVVRFSGL